MADAKMLGKTELIAKLARLPPAVTETAGVALDAGTDELVAALQRAAPVSELDDHPGQLRESIQKYRTPGRPLSWRIIAAARDLKGRLYGVWVEFGHGDAPPRPFWFPTYRAFKKRFRSKLFSDVRRVISGIWRG